jgi:hypothetical protein
VRSVRRDFTYIELPGMLKVSADIGTQSLEIGRLRVKLVINDRVSLIVRDEPRCNPASLSSRLFRS